MPRIYGIPLGHAAARTAKRPNVSRAIHLAIYETLLLTLLARFLLDISRDLRPGTLTILFLRRSDKSYSSRSAKFSSQTFESPGRYFIYLQQKDKIARPIEVIVIGDCGANSLCVGEARHR